MREIHSVGVDGFRLRLPLVTMGVQPGAKFLRRNGFMLLEYPCEISGVGEAAGVGDFGDRQRVVPKARIAPSIRIR